MLVFSKSRPPNATLAKAAFAPEIKTDANAQAATPERQIEEFVEKVIPPFPYIFVPLPAEWKP